MCVNRLVEFSTCRNSWWQLFWSEVDLYWVILKKCLPHWQQTGGWWGLCTLRHGIQNPLWKPFWLATELMLQNDCNAWQIRAWHYRKSPIARRHCSSRNKTHTFVNKWNLSNIYKFSTTVHSLITGPWKLKSCSKLSFGLKSAAFQLLKQGSVIFTRFVSLTRTEIFLSERDVIWMPLFSRHLAGPAQKLRERGHLSVTPEHERRHASI